MWSKNLAIRIAGPPLLVGVLLLALCLAAGVVLYWQQSVSAEALNENVRSNQAAHDIENTLDSLIALLREGSDQLGTLHTKLGGELDQAEDLADKPKEVELVGRMRQSFDRYLELWRSRGKAGAAEELETLQTGMLASCNELERFNADQIRSSERAHRRMVDWMVAGLGIVGTVGALTGVLMGYAVARSLRRQVAHLSVHVQNAASKLSQDLPEVALRPDGDLEHLQEQMRGVVHEIEDVVRRLQQREREVLRAEQLAAVGQLAAGVAHELRNPLTSIKMLVQTYREEAGGQGQPSEDLEVIEREIRRMERCLQHFLDFARPPRPQRRPTDLRVAVGQTLALIAGRARKQQVAVRFEPPAEAVTADIDAGQVQQLLVNLTLNALDVMPRGGVLTVELRRAGDEAEVRVSDTGPGIAAELLPRLFSPFVSGKETGLGLGLVISQRIAEGHGGSLRAANRPARGAGPAGGAGLTRCPGPGEVLHWGPSHPNLRPGLPPCSRPCWSSPSSARS